MLRIMEELLSYRISLMFSQPVDPERDECPDYLTKIKHPMDLGTIVKKIESNSYQTVADWKNDVHQVWENAYTYNRRNSLVGILAQQLESIFKNLTEFVTEDEKADWINKMHDLRNKVNAARLSAPKHLAPAKASKKQSEVGHGKTSKGTHREPEREEREEADTEDNECSPDTAAVHAGRDCAAHGRREFARRRAHGGDYQFDQEVRAAADEGRRRGRGGDRCEQAEDRHAACIAGACQPAVEGTLIGVLNNYRL